MRLFLQERPSDLRCAICHDELATGRSCPRCDARFHEDCRSVAGRCPSIGCTERASRIERTPAPPHSLHHVAIVPVGLFFLILVVAATLIPNGSWSRKGANEARAVGALRAIQAAEGAFRAHNPDHRYGTLRELIDDDLVDGAVDADLKQDYHLDVRPALDDPSGRWLATAVPVSPGKTGDRFFATNQGHVIFYSNEHPVPIDEHDATIPDDTPAVGR